jgi:hypothetical protein
MQIGFCLVPVFRFIFLRQKMLTWWQMPGPSRLTHFIAKDIRAGRNVAICLPKRTPSGIIHEIRGLLAPDDLFFASVRHEDCLENESPEDTLFRKFAPSAPKMQARTALALCEQQSFQGRVITLESIPESRWSDWKTFLSEYESISRTLTSLTRTVFVVKLIGPNALNPPEPEHLLSIRCYDGFVEKIDMLLYAATVHANRSMGKIQKQLSMSLCTELSQWDIQLSDELAKLPFMSLLDPRPMLSLLAKDMEWDAIPELVDRDVLWAEGIVHEIDGRDVFHSAYLIGRSGDRDLNQRLWQAELAVLYPLIEEKRQSIIDELNGALVMPYIGPNGETIDNVKDLEIGHLHAMLQMKSSKYLQNYRKQVGKLRILRNALAHLECVPSDILSDLRFLG